MMVSTSACSQCGAPIVTAGSAAGVPSLCANCLQISPDSAAGPSESSADLPGQPASGRRRLWVVALVALCALGMLCIASPVLYLAYFPLTATLRETQQRNQCQGNLQQISDALDAYKLKFGALPPPMVADAAGRPAHSWRILLLPFFDIEEFDTLYSQYSFEEPWDGPKNWKLHTRMPDVYACPSDPDAFGQYTSYLALINPNATSIGAWPVGLRSPNLDPTAQLIIVEVRASGITWTEPRDLDAAQLTPSVNDPSGQGIASNHLEGAHVLEGDADVTFLEDGATGPGVSPPPADVATDRPTGDRGALSASEEPVPQSRDESEQ